MLWTTEQGRIAKDASMLLEHEHRRTSGSWRAMTTVATAPSLPRTRGRARGAWYGRATRPYARRRRHDLNRPRAARPAVSSGLRYIYPIFAKRVCFRSSRNSYVPLIEKIITTGIPRLPQYLFELINRGVSSTFLLTTLCGVSLLGFELCAPLTSPAPDEEGGLLYQAV
jgi:hypothetical protein